MLGVILVNLFLFLLIVYADQRSPAFHPYYGMLVKLSFLIMICLPLGLLGITFVSLPTRFSIGSNVLGPLLYPLGIGSVSSGIPELALQYLEVFGIPLGPYFSINILGDGLFLHPFLWILTVLIILASSVLSWIVAVELGTFLRHHYERQSSRSSQSEPVTELYEQ